MTKIFEALERADRERQETFIGVVGSAGGVVEEEPGPVEPPRRVESVKAAKAAKGPKAAEQPAPGQDGEARTAREAPAEPEGAADSGPAAEAAAAEEAGTEDMTSLVRSSPYYPVVREPFKALSPQMEENLVILYQNILSLLPGETSRSIQFISATEGEGASTLAREFAKLTATKFGQRVVLLDADRRTPCQARYFNIRPIAGWIEAVLGRTPPGETTYRVGQTSLHVAQMTIDTDAGLVHDMALYDPFFEEMKQSYDMVVVDSPPATVHPDSLLLSRKVDGVVLVIESEKVRWQVAERIKDKIVKQGGNILGVILNRRKFPIPKFIYNRI